MTSASLDSLCTRISSGGTPSRKRPDYFTESGGHLWVKSQELVDRPIHDTGERISDAGLKNSSAKYFETGTVLVAMYGATVGQLAILHQPATVNQAICALCVDPTRADHRYVFYALMATRHDLVVQAAGAAQQNLNQGVIRDFQIPIFELDVQRRIAETLGHFDDLIEKNRRRIEILEETARLLYREWFVHFRFPGHEDIELVGSELGPIPSGWPVRSLGDLLVSEIGGGWGQEEPTEDEPAVAAVIRGTDIPSARRLDVTRCPIRYHKTKALQKRLLEDGDLVIEVSGGSKGQPVGRPLLVSADLLEALGGEVICASFCKLARPDRATVSPQALYLHLLETYEQGGLDQHQVQSTGITNMKWKPFLEGHRIVVPDESVREHFDELVGPMSELSGDLGRQNTVLRDARDLLIPRLISGELDVSELDLGGVGA